MLQAATSKGISKEEEDQNNDDLCVVCWERVLEVVFCNCMHMVRSCICVTLAQRHSLVVSSSLPGH